MYGRMKQLRPLCTGWKEVILLARQGERVGGMCPLCLQGWHCYGEGRELFSVPCPDRCTTTAVAFCRPLLSGAWSLQYKLPAAARNGSEKAQSIPGALTSHSSSCCDFLLLPSLPRGIFCSYAPVLPCPGRVHAVGCPRIGAAIGSCFFDGNSDVISIKDTNLLWTMTAG